MYPDAADPRAAFLPHLLPFGCATGPREPQSKGRKGSEERWARCPKTWLLGPTLLPIGCVAESTSLYLSGPCNLKALDQSPRFLLPVGPLFRLVWCPQKATLQDWALQFKGPAALTQLRLGWHQTSRAWGLGPGKGLWQPLSGTAWLLTSHSSPVSLFCLQTRGFFCCRSAFSASLANDGASPAPIIRPPFWGPAESHQIPIPSS